MNCCIYCGDWWQCRDHVIPVNYNQTHRYYKPGTTVKCCNECNSFLGSKSYHDIIRRAEFLKTCYLQKRHDQLSIPPWSQDEINKMGYNMRTSILKALATKQVYLMKLDNLNMTIEGRCATPLHSEQDGFGICDVDTALQLTEQITLECENCGEIFRYHHAIKYCSVACRLDNLRNLGVESRQYKQKGSMG